MLPTETGMAGGSNQVVILVRCQNGALTDHALYDSSSEPDELARCNWLIVHALFLRLRLTMLACY